MPRYIIADQLASKKIISTNGEELGKLIDLKINQEGKITHIIFEPNINSETARRLEKEGKFTIIPYDYVIAIADHIIVDGRFL